MSEQNMTCTTAGPWQPNSAAPWWDERWRDGPSVDDEGRRLVRVHHAGWLAWDDLGAVFAQGPETSQQGRDAADAALRAAGVVLL